jgi:exodeoxyribonuclease V alpha subunit
MPNEEITAQVTRIVYVNEHLDYFILKIEHEGGIASAKGSSSFELLPDASYRFFGKWGVNEFQGRKEPQFVFQSAVEAMPASKHAIVQYLQQFPSIGPKTAMKMYEGFGSEVFDAIEKEPEGFAEYFGGELPSWFPELQKRVHDAKHYRETMIQLGEIIDRKGFPKTTKDWAWQRWNVEAPGKIRANPFVLLEKHGIGFNRCDNLWFALSKPADSPLRQIYCAYHAVVLCNNESWVKDRVVQGYLHEKMANYDLGQAVDDAISDGLLDVDWTDAQGNLDIQGTQRWLAVFSEGRAERLIAKHVHAAVQDYVSFPMEQDQLSDHQYERINRIMSEPSGIKILTGLAGSGKSFSLATVVKQLLSQFGLEEIALAAPTGKAAVRLTESMQEYGIPLAARTLHSLLGYTPTGWTYGKDQPLEYKVVIVDEFSMVTTSIAERLFSARPSGGLMILTGDTAQLLPVGRGAPLRDLIDSESLPHAHLTEVRRNSGELLEACNEIRDGRQPVITGEGNIEFDHEPTDEGIQRATLELMRLYKPSQTMVICATNKGEHLGRRALNPLLQSAFNTNPEIEGKVFRVGDRVINRKNGWIACEEAATDTRLQIGKDMVLATAGIRYRGAKTYVANGDMGYVLDIEDNKMWIELHSPRRLVRIFVGDVETGEDNDDDAYRKHEEVIETGCNFELAWSISCHLAQGAQFPYVIIPLDSRAGRLCNRNWIYTAISRASEHCILVGDERVFRSMVANGKGAERSTFLAQRIVNQFQPQQLTEVVL